MNETLRKMGVALLAALGQMASDAIKERLAPTPEQSRRSRRQRRAA